MTTGRLVAGRRGERNILVHDNGRRLVSHCEGGRAGRSSGTRRVFVCFVLRNYHKLKDSKRSAGLSQVRGLEVKYEIEVGCKKRPKAELRLWCLLQLYGYGYRYTLRLD